MTKISKRDKTGDYRLNLNKEFKVWYAQHGYKYKPETGEEKDWCNIVRYWSWQAWEASAASQHITSADPDKSGPLS